VRFLLILFAGTQLLLLLKRWMCIGIGFICRNVAVAASQAMGVYCDYEIFMNFYDFENRLKCTEKNCKMFTHFFFSAPTQSVETILYLVTRYLKVQ